MILRWNQGRSLLAIVRVYMKGPETENCIRLVETFIPACLHQQEDHQLDRKAALTHQSPDGVNLCNHWGVCFAIAGHSGFVGKASSCSHSKYEQKEHHDYGFPLCFQTAHGASCDGSRRTPCHAARCAAPSDEVVPPEREDGITGMAGMGDLQAA